MSQFSFRYDTPDCKYSIHAQRESTTHGFPAVCTITRTNTKDEETTITWNEEKLDTIHFLRLCTRINEVDVTLTKCLSDHKKQLRSSKDWSGSTCVNFGREAERSVIKQMKTIAQTERKGEKFTLLERFKTSVIIALIPKEDENAIQLITQSGIITIDTIRDYGIATTTHTRFLAYFRKQWEENYDEFWINKRFFEGFLCKFRAPTKVSTKEESMKTLEKLLLPDLETDEQ